MIQEKLNLASTQQRTLFDKLFATGVNIMNSQDAVTTGLVLSDPKWQVVYTTSSALQNMVLELYWTPGELACARMRPAVPAKTTGGINCLVNLSETPNRIASAIILDNIIGLCDTAKTQKEKQFYKLLNLLHKQSQRNVQR